MTRRMQFFALSLIVGVSVLFGSLIGSALQRSPSVESPSATPLLLPVVNAATPMAVPSFAEIVERVNPAVVAIQNLEVRRQGSRRRGFNLFEYFFDDPTNPQGRRGDGPGEEGPPEEGEGESIPQMESGSGFIISKDGHILTNHHVVEGATKLTVILDTGERLPATVKGRDAGIDVALLKVEAPRDLPVLPLGDSDAIRIGEWVLAIGNPLGNMLGPDHSVTIGVVSAKGRRLNDIDVDVSLANYIQTDAAINFGNSGGPLVNARGEAIGINTAITRNYNNIPGLIQGIGFALPVNQAKNILDQLMTKGRVARGYLSIEIDQVDENKAKYYKIDGKRGALVQTVNRGGPADRGGIKPGDIILSVDGKDVEDNNALIRMISSRKPGEEVAILVAREEDDGRISRVSLKVKLADRELSQRPVSQSEEPGGQEDDSRAASLGFSVEEVTPRHEAQFRWPDDRPAGVLVARVDPQGRAFEAGLVQGLLLTRINRQEIASVADFRSATAAIRKGEVVRLTIALYDREARSWSSRFLFFEAE